MRFFILILSLVVLAAPPVATAQKTPDYGQIIRDIIQNVPTSPNPGPNPIPDPQQLIALPVTASYDLPSETLGAQLIVTAISQDNDALSETRLSLDALAAPISFALYVPPVLQRSDSFVVLKARINNASGTAIARTASDVLYTQGTAHLRLIPARQPTESVGTISGFETARGTVILKDAGSLFQGTTLHVELMENGLAGGRGNMVKGKVSVPIAPGEGAIPFAIEYAVPQGGFDTPLALKAYAIDWAGRTTHVMPNREDYAGPDSTYRLTLDRMRTGADVEPFDIMPPDTASPDISPPQAELDAAGVPGAMPAIISISGQATFAAVRGLPLGAVLTVELWQRMGGVDTAVMTRRNIPLDGLSGDVSFTLPPARAALDPSRIDPDLWLGGRITTQEGVVLFDTQGQPLIGGNPLLTLYATPQY